MIKRYKNARKRRQTRVRSKVKVTKVRPRLSVFRSSKYIYAQIINDEKGETIVACGDLNEKFPAKVQTRAPSGFDENQPLAEKNKNAVPAGHVSRQADRWEKLKKTEMAKLVGRELAKRALKAGIKSVAFDRGGYRYHGRVRALAEGAREGGLNF